MDTGIDDIILNDDENARDEFSARYFFKQNRPLMGDIANPHKLDVKKFGITKCVLNDRTNRNYTKENDKEVLSLKRKSSDSFCENVKTNRVESYFVPYRGLPHSSSDVYSASEFTVSLSVPANGYNECYSNQIAVPEPWRVEKLSKIDHKSVAGSIVLEKAKVETRTMSVPCRKGCCPQEQYSLTPQLQYKSDCLIKSYHSPASDVDSFPEAIIIDAGNKISRRHCYMPESVNISHFHELYLEKLPCNQLFHFMPLNNELTGSLLGGFINDLFELSKYVYLPSEVIHMAVDYIYQYLSRVHDVPLNDLKLVTLGAIWVASKFEGLQYRNQICQFADCSTDQLHHAELRLLMVIDFNLTKPNAINFRNRYIIIESSTSTISHLSSFILDMTLHCYTVMILPASKRAAAALWLSRLIEKFDDIRFGDEHENASERMHSVWPDHYHKLTGYHHSEISQLAIKMHVIVLALLCRGQQKNPSVNACYNKYSNDTYKNLTASYEKFTSRIVYYGAELYCRLNGLSITDWLEKNEYETIQVTVCDQKPLLRRYHSYYYYNCHDKKTDPEVNSCPELSSQALITGTNNHKHHTTSTITHRLLKLDSGYSTCSNMTNDTSSQDKNLPL